ncbi:TGS domain-containing protein [ANME-2 cluster archaeon]|nr:MAG: TGS domain-containing protein [ANME-2 cluster archaeon]
MYRQAKRCALSGLALAGCLFLMRRGSTAHDLAYQIHTDIGEGFLYAVDARQRMRMGRVLEDGDVVKIVSTR